MTEHPRIEALEAAGQELAGYVRALLAGQDSRPELQWALKNWEEAFAAELVEGRREGER